jgi:dCMP deaminase
MQERIDLEEAYMQMAEIWAKRSYARRAQVGAILVKNKQIISDGYNGLPSGFPHNELEYLDDQGNLVTSPLALHAESNALMKLVRNGGGVSSEGADLYVTMSPCFDCAKLIIQAKIKRVFYRTKYRRTESFEILNRAGIEVIHLPANETNAQLAVRVLTSWQWKVRRVLKRFIAS